MSGNDRLTTDTLRDGVNTKVFTNADATRLNSAIQPQGVPTNDLIPKWNNKHLEDGYKVGTQGNDLVQLTVDGKLPHLDASLLYNIKADIAPPSGAGIDVDTDGLTTHALVKWNATEGKFVTSNVYSNERGALSIEPASLTIGAHNIQSNGEILTVKDKQDNSVVSLLTQTITKNGGEGLIRVYDDEKAITVNNSAGQQLTNPYFEFPVTPNTSIMGFKINLQTPANDVLLEIHNDDKNDLCVWEYRAGDLAQGVQEIRFDTPIDLKPRVTYKLKIYREDGNNLFLMGGASGSSVKPYLITFNVPYTDHIIATQNWTQGLHLANDVTLIGDKLTITFQDGKTEVITIPDATDYTQLKNTVNAHETAIEKQAGEIQTNLQTITNHKQELDKAVLDATDLENKVSRLSASQPTVVDVSGNKDTHTLTVKLLHDTTVLSTASYSLTDWFEHPITPAPGPTEHTIYYGFHDTQSFNEASIQAGASATNVSNTNLNGYPLHFTRPDGTQEMYLFAWIPDSLGSVNGFKLTFIDSWSSQAITVGGIIGKVYFSDNPTHTTDVIYKVDA